MSEKKPTLEEIKEAILDPEGSIQKFDVDVSSVPEEEVAKFRAALKSGKKGIEWAATHHTEDLQEEIDIVLEAIGISSAFVSDRSMVWDFGLEEEELEQARKTLGVEIDTKDYLYQVAQRVRDK